MILCSLLSQGLAGIQPVDIPGIQNVSFFQFPLCMTIVASCCFLFILGYHCKWVF